MLKRIQKIDLFHILCSFDRYCDIKQKQSKFTESVSTLLHQYIYNNSNICMKTYLSSFCRIC